MGDNLFEKFNAATSADWENQVGKDLKGKTSLDIKSTYPFEDIIISPYFAEGPELALPGIGSQGWKIRGHFSPSKIDNQHEFLNPEAIAGFDEVLLDAGDFRKFSYPEKYPDSVSFHLNLTNYTPEILVSLQNFLKMVDPSNNKHSISYDPIASLIKKGSWTKSLTDDLKDFTSFINGFKSADKIKYLIVNAQIYGLAGGSAIQELAFATAHLNEYLHRLKAADVLKNVESDKIELRLSIGGNYMLEIAKFRALRFLVSQLFDSYGVDSDGTWDLAGENNVMFYSAVDPDSNLLRSTTAAMSAIIGGCQSLMLHPHDDNKQQFAQRIARNIQLILKHEVYLDKVKDAASGAYYLDELTRSLASESWELFQQIESDGGLIAEFEKGNLQLAVQKITNMRIERITNKKDTVIGINKYMKTEDRKVSEKPLVAATNSTYPPLVPLSFEEIVR